MPKIEIRPAVTADIIELISIDHSCRTNYVWQMDRTIEDGQIFISFREIRLPRPTQVNYPRQVELLEDEWQQSPGLMVAIHNGNHVGYIRIVEVSENQSAVIKDLVVEQGIRRQGIGTALVLAAQNWAVQRANRRLLLEIPPKSYPAIKLAFKLGFDFSGYNDSYYPNKDIALFFSKYLK